MKKLLPCPFCGGEAGIERTGTPRQSCIVACVNCGARHESGDEAQFSGASWNRRTQPAPVTSVEVPRLTNPERAKILASIPSVPYEGDWHSDLIDAIEAALIAKWSKT